MSILIRNIGKLYLVGLGNIRMLKGSEMQEIPVLENAFVFCKDQLIADFGSMENMPEEYESAVDIIEAEGSIVFPGFCDPHTHLVFAGSREKEFVDRIHGLSYEEIARRGGGILNSAKKLRETSEDELFLSASKRIGEIMNSGTVAVEIKSGYGLDTDSEIKMLRVIKRLKAHFPLEIRSTFLGAHALPLEYKENRSEYIRQINEIMLPKIAEEGLADYCDVFCDKGFFTPDETDSILQKAGKLGLIAKIHANELDFSGGIQVGVKNKALSVDHLEFTGDEEIELLKNSETMPTLLPSTAFFLRLHYPPARKMIESGLPVALASDYNPGSSPSGRMSFILSLACVQMRMSPEEALSAATLNAAYAMGLEQTHGSIDKGKFASLVVSEHMDSVAYIPYSYGNDRIKNVIIKGKIIR